jgi:3-deoxy-D-manno-octulosonate 8-phosphate phosphatase (KDO 8-P phosphatase)
VTADLAARLAAIRLLTLDVDGVLTDGRVYVDDDGRETKAFYAPDGVGVRMLQFAGVTVALITGSSAPAVAHRARRLQIEHVLQGNDDKLPGWRGLVARLGIAPSACAHMGDDLPDLPLMRASAAAFSVAHAPLVVREAAHYVARTPPGLGAVREVCELILEARGALDACVAQYDGAPTPASRR